MYNYALKYGFTNNLIGLVKPNYCSQYEQMFMNFNGYWFVSTLRTVFYEVIINNKYCNKKPFFVF